MLQQLIVENKTANILLTFGSEPKSSEVVLDRDNRKINATKNSIVPSMDGGHSADGHTSHDQDSVSDKTAISVNEDDQYETDQSASRSSKKRKSGGDLPEGGSLRRNDSIHFGSISDMSIMNTQQTERVVKMLHQGMSKDGNIAGEHGGEQLSPAQRRRPRQQVTHEIGAQREAGHEVPLHHR